MIIKIENKRTRCYFVLSGYHSAAELQHEKKKTGSGSYVEDEGTQERIPLREQGGMYMLKLWVRNQSFQSQADEVW